MNFQMLCRLKVGKSHTLNKESLLGVNITLHGNWFTKSGTARKVDLLNFEKTLIDTVFEILNLKDENIFTMTLNKIQGDDKTELEIYEISRP